MPNNNFGKRFSIVPLEKFVQSKFDSLISRIEQNDSTLTYVNLARTLWGPRATKEEDALYSVSDWIRPSLGSNELHRLAEALSQNTTVTTINLDGQFNGLTEPYDFSKDVDEGKKKTIRYNLTQLLPTLVKHPTLTTINLNNNILYIASDLLIAAFATAKTPKQLNLQDNNITEVGSWLHTVSPSIRVDFTDNPIDVESITDLVEIQRIQQGHTLRQLDLERIPLSAEAWMHVLEYCTQYNNELTHLKLSRPYQQNKEEMITQDNRLLTLARFLQNTPHLQTLSLARNQLGSDEIIQLLLTITTCNPLLTELNLRENLIDVTGGHAIANFLQTNPTLQKLDLSHNLLMNSGMSSILDALTVNQNLIALKMSHNNWAPREEGPFPPVIVQPHAFQTLQELDLSQNNVIVLLNPHCQNKGNLKKLDLSDNRLTLSQAIPLVEYGKTTGLKLQLQDNKFDMGELIAHCGQNHTLRIPESAQLPFWKLQKSYWERPRHKNSSIDAKDGDQMELENNSDSEEKAPKRSCNKQ
jgi:Ran GTPase-activating protein (RanGAP) involved in mRNA processing and transport